MKLSDLLDSKVITTNLKARDKRGALREMVGILHKTGRIRDVDSVFMALMDREAIVTTGQGMTFPHARIDGLKKTVALLAISQRGVDFNATDGHLTYLFFLFLTSLEDT